ncbi:uncharacterized protein [Venturia canescens]|uniref:uncharacterized protein n=1 Tax=Venturia canescens TaxID=32260 RepID=UPI001C9CC76A|nr:uncharacterized protein LOC122412319 [Venturia canescens]
MSNGACCKEQQDAPPKKNSTLPPKCCHCRPVRFTCPKNGCPPFEPCIPVPRCRSPCTPLVRIFVCGQKNRKNIRHKNFYGPRQLISWKSHYAAALSHISERFHDSIWRTPPPKDEKKVKKPRATLCIARPCPQRPGPIPYSCSATPKLEVPPSTVTFAIRYTCEGPTYCPCYSPGIPSCPSKQCCL